MAKQKVTEVEMPNDYRESIQRERKRRNAKAKAKAKAKETPNKGKKR